MAKERTLIKRAIKSLKLKFNTDEPKSLKCIDKLIQNEEFKKEEMIQVIEEAQEALEMLDENVLTLNNLKHQYKIEEFIYYNPKIEKDNVF